MTRGATRRLEEHGEGDVAFSVAIDAGFENSEIMISTRPTVVALTVSYAALGYSGRPLLLRPGTLTHRDGNLNRRSTPDDRRGDSLADTLHTQEPLHVVRVMHRLAIDRRDQISHQHSRFGRRAFRLYVEHDKATPRGALARR
jgi:hypothetical protein